MDYGDSSRYLGGTAGMNIVQRKTVKVLFDEWHSESWSCSRLRAAEIQPEDPAGASYQRAADSLALRDFVVERNAAGPLTKAALNGAGVLVLAHPCDPRWERTTSQNSPALSSEEMEAVLDWVRAGGGLLVISEYEHDKYGDNLNELLAPVGIRIENGKVFDREACQHGNPEWFLASPEERSPLRFQAGKACFYRAGWCRVEAAARIAWSAGASAFPQRAGVIAIAPFGEGRVAVVTDSVLFGDERLGEHDHEQLWLNLVYWLAVAANRRSPAIPAEPSALKERVLPLIEIIDRLRELQQPDGSVPAEHHSTASALVREIRELLAVFTPDFPHENEYFAALRSNFEKWASSDFARPDFTEALSAFNPQNHRRDNLHTLAVFPMYTPNASSDTRFEAILFRTPWPDWLALLEGSRFENSKFVPGHLAAFSAGYRSECAVLFPETVSIRGRATNQFATIFCDREAARLQRTALNGASVVNLELHPELEFWLKSCGGMVEETLALWDLFHDTSHSMGELPFDPFMIRQRAPFWMYGLEELRVDLRSYGEAVRLTNDPKRPFPFARYVTYAILLDRIFRFPITGARVRNYDALGGQLLFAYLHQRDVLLWSDNQLTVRWEELESAVAALRDELRALYKLGSDCSKMTFWLAAHDLISKYVRPNVASKWKSDSRAITDEADLKRWIDLVHPDEFPLGTFHQNLKRNLESGHTSHS